MQCSITYELLINGKELYTLTEKLYTVGRSPLCDIHLKGDRSLSRKHCEISRGGNGRYHVCDGDSLLKKTSVNGTKINGIQLNPDYAQELADGDEIELSPLIKIKFFARNRETPIDADSTLL